MHAGVLLPFGIAYRPRSESVDASERQGKRHHVCRSARQWQNNNMYKSKSTRVLRTDM